MIAPDAGDFVYKWFGGERVLGDCYETEVRHHMGVSQCREGIAQQQELGDCGRDRNGSQSKITTAGPPERQN